MLTRGRRTHSRTARLVLHGASRTRCIHGNRFRFPPLELLGLPCARLPLACAGAREEWTPPPPARPAAAELAAPTACALTVDRAEVVEACVVEEVERAGLDEGLLPLSLFNLVYMENPYS